MVSARAKLDTPTSPHFRMEVPGITTSWWTIAKKLLFVLFLFQSVLLLAYFNFSRYFNVTAAIPTFNPVFRTTDRGKVHTINDSTNLDYSGDLEIKFPDRGRDGEETLTHGTNSSVSIAVGLAITTRIKKSQLKDIKKHIFFTSLMPTFCETASRGYLYNFYIAFDFDDILLSKYEQLKLFNQTFSKVRNSACKNLTYMGLNFVNCSHTRKPAWAQNDAMMSAYMDDNQYFYRINDDTRMITKGWTEIFIQKLSEYIPPNVGVVGPTHSGGNLAILTYDFVHRSHVDIFGFYYPRDFMDWHGDRWITDVYKPGRITKVANVKLKHTMSSGTRYKFHRLNAKLVSGVIAREKNTLVRYIKAKASNPGHLKSRVIAMSLIGGNATDMHGVIRNIMLQPIHFPTWTVRIYSELPPDDARHLYPPIPSNVAAQLKQLPVQLVYVNTQNVKLDPSLWPALAVDDESVDYLLVRKPSGRISDRDAAVVREWMESEKVVHVIKDHPRHSANKIIPGLWGADTKGLRNILGGKISPLLAESQSEPTFLNDVLWPRVANNVWCHDSTSCSNRSHPFPVARANQEYLGQAFGPFGEPAADKFNGNADCVKLEVPLIV